MEEDYLKDLFNELKEGNLESRNKIIEAKIPLIKHIVREDYNIYYDIKEDLESIGYIALINSLKTYDINKGDFTFYVSNQVHWAIKKYLYRKDVKWTKLNSIDQQINVSSNDVNTLTLQEIATDINNVSVEEKIELIEEYQLIKKALNILSPFEKKVLELRYGFITNNFLTYEQLKDIFGYKHSTSIFKVHKRALSKIKDYFKTGILTPTAIKNIELNYLISLDKNAQEDYLDGLNINERIVMEQYFIKSKDIIFKRFEIKEIADQVNFSRKQTVKIINQSLKKIKR
ncbi:MAG: sigma-70 family RNA polymerase sigma factor [Tenericutes bacterium]|nr:sigma-70 family RNA polymerase sigma factor [Mycoplasmatota bacterium]